MQRTIESILKKWKDSTQRMPAILRGARQVGKRCRGGAVIVVR